MYDDVCLCDGCVYLDGGGYGGVGGGMLRECSKVAGGGSFVVEDQRELRALVWRLIAADSRVCRSTTGF
mgnify:CR=1 FL=1